MRLLKLCSNEISIVFCLQGFSLHCVISNRLLLQFSTADVAKTADIITLHYIATALEGIGLALEIPDGPLGGKGEYTYKRVASSRCHTDIRSPVRE